MWTGGVSLPWNLLLSALVGVWLMGTRLVFDTQAPMAHSDHLLGALVITVSITALAEVARAVRFINALFGICLMGAPWMLEGGRPAGRLGGRTRWPLVGRFEHPERQSDPWLRRLE
ncbi:MAG: SPW repeat domain-containing protein [Gammaproteobacteria bacterium]